MKAGGNLTMDQERVFLHDISSPLTSIHLNVENAICVLEDAKPESVADCLKLLQSCLVQTGRVAEMIRARREELVKLSKK